MTGSRSRPRPWLLRVGQALTIIVSILLALFAEAAWGWRMDRLEERELLEALQVEFAEAQEELEFDRAARGEIVEVTDRLLRARHGLAPLPPADSVPELLFHLTNWRFYTPPHPALDDALSSGRLELIRSNEVRLALMRYVQERERVAVSDQGEIDFVQIDLQPFLAERLALDALAWEEAPSEATARESARFLGLLPDDRFGSLLHLRLDRTEGAVRFAGIVGAAVEDVRAALDRALGGR